jgi:hypothetical protein
MAIIKFTYDNNEISFQPDFGKNLMINATEMANIFGKEVTHFLQNEGTHKFIDACLNTRNSEYLNLKSREDLVVGRQKTGTWMHRILAIKFAAWLNPDFEVWVYSTIEDLIFGQYKRLEESLKASAKRKVQIDELRNKLAESEEFQTLERLELEERQAAYRRSRENSAQLELFKIEA